MPQAGFEPTIPVFEQEKTAHALGYCDRHLYNIPSNNN
jgi:hypothetical protein